MDGRTDHIRRITSDTGFSSSTAGSRLLGIGTWSWCTLTGRLAWSDGVYVLLKLSPDHPASWESWISHVHPDDREMVRGTLARTLHGDVTETCGYRIMRGDGSVIWIEDRRHMSADGACEGAFIDVTRTMASGQDSFQPEGLFNVAMEIAGIGAYFRDFRTGFDYWNNALFSICGLPATSPPPAGGLLLPGHHPEETEHVRREVDRCRTSDEPLRLEYRIVRPDGEQRWVRERGCYLKAVTGQLLSYYGIVEDISEERIRTRELEESRRHLRLALNANNTAIWEWNRTANTQFWSDELYRMFGFEPGEILPNQQNWLAIVHPDDHDWVSRFVAIDGRSEVHSFTYRVIVKGEVRWIRESWNDLAGDDGVRVRVGVSADVTDWKEREHHQSATESWFDLAVDIGRIGLWSRNSEDFTNHWNDHVYSLLGYQPGSIEPSDKAWIDRIHPADRERVLTTVEDRRRDGVDNIMEYRVILPGGTVRWLEERGGAMDASSTIRRGVLFDITEQKISQQRLEENRQRLQLALDTGSMGFWTANANEEHWDEQTYRLLGYEPFAVPANSESFLRVVHPDDRQRVLAGENRSRLSGKLALQEYRIIRPDGSVRWIESRNQMSPSDSLGSYGVLLDITDRKTRDEINFRNSKLLSAGQLLRGLAHDYNHFLAVIGASLDTLGNMIHEPKAKRRLFEARQITMAGALFSRRLINISRYREWQPQVLSLGKQISQLAKMTKPLMRPGITLVLACPADLWPVKVDPIELDSALINMLINSRDAMPSGGSITIKAVNVHLTRDTASDPSRAGDYVLLTVRDTGTGMDKSTLSNATEPFFTTKREGAGTGLGLSSVTNFTEAAGGYVVIESVHGSGTSVSLYLPRAPEPAEIKADEPASLLPRGNGELILVVDDEDSMRETLMQRLEALGYAVEEASDAAMAMDKILSLDSVDLVLSDIMMPGPLDGIGLRNRLAVEMPRVPVVLITSDFEISRRQNKTLFKSCSQMELAKVIALALARPLPS